MPKFYLLSKKIINFVLIGVLAFVVLYPKIPLASVSGTYVAIRLEDLLIAILLIIWGFLNIRHIKYFFSETIYQAFLLYWLIGLVSIFSAIFVTSTIVPHLGLLHLLRRIEYMSLFFVAATTVSSLKQIKVLLITFLFVTLIVVFYGFGQIYLNLPVISTTNKEFSKGLLLSLTPGARANSTFAGHYDLAVYLSITLIFLGTLFFYYKKILQKAIIAIVSLLTFFLLGLTAARVSFFATLISLTFIFWLVGKKILIIILIVASILAIGIIPELRHRIVATVTVNLLEGGGPKYQPPPNKVDIFTPLGEGTSPEQQILLDQVLKDATDSASKSATLSADIAPGEPINPTELGVYRSLNIRLDVEWPRALRAFLKNPILGTGYSSITIATDNDILRSLGEVGLFGTASLILIFYILIRQIFISIKLHTGFEKAFLIATLCSVLAIIITGLFIDVLEASKIAAVFWIILGVSWAIINKYKDVK